MTIPYVLGSITPCNHQQELNVLKAVTAEVKFLWIPQLLRTRVSVADPLLQFPRRRLLWGGPFQSFAGF